MTDIRARVRSIDFKNTPETSSDTAPQIAEVNSGQDGIVERLAVAPVIGWLGSKAIDLWSYYRSKREAAEDRMLTCSELLCAGITQEVAWYRQAQAGGYELGEGSEDYKVVVLEPQEDDRGPVLHLAPLDPRARVTRQQVPGSGVLIFVAESEPIFVIESLNTEPDITLGQEIQLLEATYSALYSARLQAHINKTA